MEFMARWPDKHFELAIVDPNYGRKQHGGTDRSGHYVRQFNGKNIYTNGPRHAKKDWDKKPVSAEFFTELKRISNHQIIFGVNYYSVVLGPGRIVWDKVNDGSDQSGAELAYCSMNDRVDIFRFMWRGMMQAGSIFDGTIKRGDVQNNEKIIHPTQKPVALYKWLLSRYAKPGWKILDTHLGSGSSRIAAHDLGFDFWGTEFDADYFRDEEARFAIHASQLTLIQPEDLPPLQGALGL